MARPGGRLNLINFLIYTLFGAMATLVNMGSYHALYEWADMANVPSTLLAWFLAVTFAFFTNKFLVFRSRSVDRRTVLREIAQHFSCRIGTGILDVIIMYIAVDLLAADALLWKLISNLIVGLINYTVGQIVIFKDKQR